jgi:KUP system potassium uptake protein
VLACGAPPAPSRDVDQQPEQPRGRRLAVLSLAALGVVYGDIGTSPLYAVRECFHGEFGVEPTPANVLGVLSLVFWALAIVVSVKYLTFVLRADNHGEGGVIALAALIRPARTEGDGAGATGRKALLLVGLFAAALLYGDGMITPAISVLSAVEGLSGVGAHLERFVLPLTVVILAGLFLLQSRGTARVGSLFGPVTLIWFLVIGTLGALSIAHRPGVFLAVLPWHGALFLARNGVAGFLVLGAVFLVVTGAEALYADMGHFGRLPIRAAWWTVALPALLLNYFGQGALLLESPGAASDPFYSLAPPWLLVPLLVLATAATIIASQAVISGSFSLTRQAIQLGYLPRMKVVHTSAEEIGQVYVPRVNWLLMLATIGLVLGFRSSGSLAAAYGVAVTTTMLITSVLFYVVCRTRFGWSRAAAGGLASAFVVVDLAFFGANVSKILHGAWFPLVVGAVVYVLMTTWSRGRTLLQEKVKATSPGVEELARSTRLVPRVEGKAVFLTSDPGVAPSSILHNLKHNRILHSAVAYLTVVTEDVPRVPREEKVEVHDLGEGFHQVIAHYGFMETPKVPHVLALAREKGLDFPLEEVSFFLSRERFVQRKRPELTRWRRAVFAFLSRNAIDATSFYGIPAGQVVEIGTQVQL